LFDYNRKLLSRPYVLQLEITVACSFDGELPSGGEDPFQEFRELAESARVQANESISEVELLTPSFPEEDATPDQSPYRQLSFHEVDAIFASTYALQPVHAAQEAIEYLRYRHSEIIRQKSVQGQMIGWANLSDANSSQALISPPDPMKHLGEMNARYVSCLLQYIADVIYLAKGTL
jgi:hypothetical protein